ncbi:MAG: cytochrome P450 [Rhodospirillales bacterium]
MPLLARHVVAAYRAKEEALARLAHRPLELLPHLQNLALTIAGQSMFSLEMAGFGDELRALIIEYGTHYAQPGLFDLVLPGRVPTGLARGRARFREKWLAFLDRVIAARAALPAEEGRARDMFDLLASARDPETGAAFSHAQLRDEVSTMILAGHETTSVTLFWCFYLASLYPDLQEVLAEEAGALPIDGAEALAALPRTRAFVDEALRLYPPAFLLVREAVAADEVAGRAVAPGTVVMVSPWVLHRHRALWRDPECIRSGTLSAGGARGGPVSPIAVRGGAADLRGRVVRADRGGAGAGAVAGAVPGAVVRRWRGAAAGNCNNPAGSGSEVRVFRAKARCRRACGPGDRAGGLNGGARAPGQTGGRHGGHLRRYRADGREQGAEGIRRQGQDGNEGSRGKRGQEGVGVYRGKEGRGLYDPPEGRGADGGREGCELQTDGRAAAVSQAEMVTTSLTGGGRAAGMKPEDAVEDCIGAVVEDMMKKVVPVMKKQAR